MGKVCSFLTVICVMLSIRTSRLVESIKVFDVFFVVFDLFLELITRIIVVWSFCVNLKKNYIEKSSYVVYPYNVCF